LVDILGRRFEHPMKVVDDWEKSSDQLRVRLLLGVALVLANPLFVVVEVGREPQIALGRLLGLGLELLDPGSQVGGSRHLDWSNSYRDLGDLIFAGNAFRRSSPPSARWPPSRPRRGGRRSVR